MMTRGRKGYGPEVESAGSSRFSKYLQEDSTVQEALGTADDADAPAGPSTCNDGGKLLVCSTLLTSRWPGLMVPESCVAKMAVLRGIRLDQTYM